MTVRQRFFQFDDQWCILHLPERPNGFAILLLGDVNHYVTDSTSFWLEHHGRRKLLEELLTYGYTVFSSHLYGRHWGCPKAVRLTKQLIYYVLKSEILNNRVYILAEGIGALVALQLLADIPTKIRAVALLNPCLDVRAQLAYEKENKFFYKRMRKEIATAYEILETEVENVLPSLTRTPRQVPVKIWQLSGVTPYPSALHCRNYEEQARNQDVPVDVVYHLPEKRYCFAASIHQFYEQHNALP
ncbi:pimeloyl-ACP methyl ester carboxylesterase [Anoxybacillus voinovskiensis]|uniref:Pimeloyl-ACP methyl ester carboxylesterase n=1 Tax=Anoxybacteroides voinovskiense TaxID=230470 RepID=A0A840DMX0_9BACL|nr:hypothetical protein [Anoxybacillus voinovskiensis]MBB4074414.1 pimeloyl-ACP methyl ester carboxylesterase [Anoxybacillus voinovskiensis]GGJ70060.1 hypothetical protein GCM10008982_19260 [Anoxybacillus voinovskiensis]